MKLLIINGNVANPKGQSGSLDILISKGKIEKIAPAGSIDSEGAQVIDAKGLTVMPAFIDMHVHLREPGQEYKEDITSGTLAAVYGGYAGVCAMPNTSPVNDDITVLEFINSKAKKAHCKVYPICAITKGLAGKELTEMGILSENGAIAFSDDGKPVSDANRMRLAIQYAKNFDALLMSHCEVSELAVDGQMNEGYFSSILGLKGITRVAEEAMVARDILLCEAYKGKVHFCHISTRGSVELIRQAKARGANVSCETAPHYFSATDEWVQGYDANTKMNPPLRTADDVQAIIEGLADGTIDAIATDHAPHCRDEKLCEFNNALNGIIGLETAFSLAVTNLIKTGAITINQLVEKLSVNPCSLLKIEGGILKEGAVADIAIADLDATICYEHGDSNIKPLHSKSKNSPFMGKNYFGDVLYTIIGGNIAMKRR